MNFNQLSFLPFWESSEEKSNWLRSMELGSLTFDSELVFGMEPVCNMIGAVVVGMWIGSVASPDAVIGGNDVGKVVVAVVGDTWEIMGAIVVGFSFSDSWLELGRPSFTSSSPWRSAISVEDNKFQFYLQIPIKSFPLEVIAKPHPRLNT